MDSVKVGITRSRCGVVGLVESRDRIRPDRERVGGVSVSVGGKVGSQKLRELLFIARVRDNGCGR